MSMSFTIVCSYMQQMEIFVMQTLCTRFYNIDIARSQLKIRLEPELKFAIPINGETGRHLFFARMHWEKAIDMSSSKFEFRDCEVFSIGRNVYSISPGNLAVTKYTNTHKESSIKVKKDVSTTPFIGRKMFSITLALHEFRVFLTGGTESGVASANCLYFDLLKEQWSATYAIPELNEPRF